MLVRDCGGCFGQVGLDQTKEERKVVRGDNARTKRLAKLLQLDKSW